MTLSRCRGGSRLARRGGVATFVRDTHGASTMEFVIVFPVIMLLFVAVFETGTILTRQVLMERSLDNAVRMLRLAQNLTLQADDIEQAICDNTGAILDCEDVLTIDLQTIDRTTYAMPANDVLCVDRENLPVQPANTFEQGGDNDLVLIRACAVIDRILPLSGLGLNLTRDDTGGLHMVATSVFVNEPD